MIIKSSKRWRRVDGAGKHERIEILETFETRHTFADIKLSKIAQLQA